jgi:hypothetical protein
MNARLMRRWAAGLSALWTLWLAAPAAQAQEYKVSWFGLGNDTMCTGDVYSTRGTIGCTDIGPMTNGAFMLNEGGYCRLPIGLWRLMIAQSGARSITWPIPENPAYLYYAVALLPAPEWILIPPTQYQVVGENVSVNITNLPAACYYRLEGP